MKQYINAARLVTKIKMLRSGKSYKGFMVVEGVTDYRLYGKFVDKEACEIIIADSKSNVIECIEACNSQKLQGILGIVDADFSRLDGSEYTAQNLFLTDYHDLECMLVNSPAFENILAEYADTNKYLRFEERRKMPVKTIILENTAKIGYLRWYSLLNNLGLKFSRLDFNKFVNQTDLEINMTALIEYVLSESKKQNILKPEKVLKDVGKLMNRQHNLWDVCCGHDFVEILSIGLTHIFGDYNAKSLFSGNMEGSLRLAYEYNYFLNTQLWHFWVIWQSENKNYNIFNHEVMQRVI